MLKKKGTPIKIEVVDVEKGKDGKLKIKGKKNKK